MSYIEQSLSTGENIEAIFKFQWFVWIPVFIWFVLGFVTLGITWTFALYQFLRIKHTEQGLTNKRLILKTGIIGRKTQEMKLKAIETVEINQGVLGRIFGFGTIKVTGRGISDFFFTGIDNPMAVKRRIESVRNPVE